MRRVLLGLSFLLILAGSAFAALHFPALNGRVVDEAGILSSGTVQELDQLLAGYEQRTTNQVVVVTVKSLEGTSVEDYGYQLGREWGIGQKDKNNGALLIVAPAEHKVRIEVGYGLEGVLTDAICSEIIHEIILPAFRAGKMEAGTVSGAHAILAALEGTSPTETLKQMTDNPQTGEYQPSRYEQQRGRQNSIGNLFGFIFLLIVFFINFIRTLIYGRRRGLGGFYGGIGGGGFSGGSGGFSGGGGSFGGGGASGGW